MERAASPFTPRDARLGGGALAAGAAAVATEEQLGPALARRAPRAVPLPSPRQVRRDFQRMVDFGPRLTGSAAHNRFIAWLDREFVKAGLKLRPCDVYDIERW